MAHSRSSTSMIHWSQGMQAKLLIFHSHRSLTMSWQQHRATPLWKSGWSPKKVSCKIWKKETNTPHLSATRRRYRYFNGTLSPISPWLRHPMTSLSRFGTSKTRKRRWITPSMISHPVLNGTTTESWWGVYPWIKWCISTIQEFSGSRL